MSDVETYPQRVLGFYDVPFWDHLADGAFKLQQCDECQTFRYPPGPVCHDCLSPDFTWQQVSGEGEIISYVIFHKQYLEGYPIPYNCIAVRLDEGPLLVSNLEGAEPAGDWIGKRVEVVLVPLGDAYVLPRFTLA